VIVTVTPNPSIDRTLRIPPLSRGAIHRALSATTEAGGKGINVSRALASQGFATAAVLPVSEASSLLLGDLLSGAFPLETVPIEGEIRVNITLMEADGTVTKINEPGPTIRPDHAAAIVRRAVELAAGADWVVGCGSLPPGAPVDLYGRLARSVGGSTRVAVDADGAALRQSLGSGVALLKPNRGELEELVGRRLPTLGDVIECASDLVGGGAAAAMLVSLGPDGAVYVDSAGASHAEADLVDVVNPVGAGDALLAGFLAAGGNGSALGSAVAWSVAACRSAGTEMGPVTATDAASVVVHPTIEPARRLAA
jgi:1-phosphofructokinase